MFDVSVVQDVEEPLLSGLSGGNEQCLWHHCRDLAPGADPCRVKVLITTVFPHKELGTMLAPPPQRASAAVWEPVSVFLAIANCWRSMGRYDERL